MSDRGRAIVGGLVSSLVAACGSAAPGGAPGSSPASPPGRPSLYQTEDATDLVVIDDEPWAPDAIRQLP